MICHKFRHIQRRYPMAADSDQMPASPKSRVIEVSDEECDERIRDVMERLDLHAPGLAIELRNWVWLRYGVTL